MAKIETAFEIINEFGPMAFAFALIGAACYGMFSLLSLLALAAKVSGL